MAITIKKIEFFFVVVYLLHRSVCAVDLDDIRSEQVLVFVTKQSSATQYELKVDSPEPLLFHAWFCKKKKRYELTNLGVLSILTALTKMHSKEGEIFALTACQYDSSFQSHTMYPVFIPKYKLCLSSSSVVIEKKKQQIVVVNDLRVWCCVREAISGSGIMIHQFDKEDLECFQKELMIRLSEDFRVSLETTKEFFQSQFFLKKVEDFFYNFDRFDSFKSLQSLLVQYEKTISDLIGFFLPTSKISGDDLMPMTTLILLVRLQVRSFYMFYLFVLISEDEILFESFPGAKQYSLVTLSSAFQYLLFFIQQKNGQGLIEKEKTRNIFFQEFVK